MAGGLDFFGDLGILGINAFGDDLDREAIDDVKVVCGYGESRGNMDVVYSGQ